MATIIVVTHVYDAFLRRVQLWEPTDSKYLLFHVLRAVEDRGHHWRVAAGPRALPGDVAILHVDSTIVDEDYLALATHYPITVNFKVSDISKRRVSGAMLSADSAWTGPVIVKTDLNFAGRSEATHNARALTAGRPAPHAPVAPARDYVVLPSIAAVGQAIWDDPSLVVDRFLPEPDAAGFAMRTWVFMGARERCSRHVSRDPMVKARSSISRMPVEVPDALRAERARLGFDYGKFDFVVHDGRPILLDANRTPGATVASGAVLRARVALLADGLHDLIVRAV